MQPPETRSKATLSDSTFQGMVLGYPWPGNPGQGRGARRVSRKRPDTVGEVGSGGEGGEAGSAGSGARDRPEPGGEPFEVDRGRGRHVLQVRLGQPPIAA